MVWLWCGCGVALEWLWGSSVLRSLCLVYGFRVAWGGFRGFRLQGTFARGRVSAHNENCWVQYRCNTGANGLQVACLFNGKGYLQAICTGIAPVLLPPPTHTSCQFPSPSVFSCSQGAALFGIPPFAAPWSLVKLWVLGHVHREPPPRCFGWKLLYLRRPPHPGPGLCWTWSWEPKAVSQSARRL